MTTDNNDERAALEAALTEGIGAARAGQQRLSDERAASEAAMLARLGVFSAALDELHGALGYLRREVRATLTDPAYLERIDLNAPSPTFQAACLQLAELRAAREAHLRLMAPESPVDVL